MNRAWADYVPTFADIATGTADADTEADYRKAAEKIPVPFLERIEKALEKQGSGPYFNGARGVYFAGGCGLRNRSCSAISFFDRVRALGHIKNFPD